MRILLTTAALACTLAATPAAAQRQPSPEQRVERLERQVRQLQGRIFPKGQPVDTAGLSNEPAASQVVVVALSNRLDNIERQLAEIIRTSEENGNRVATLEAELARFRADQDQRLRALETAPVSSGGATPNGLAAAAAGGTAAPATPVVKTTGDIEADGEAAYDAGYQLWQQKKYDQAVTALRAMASSFPNHRRASWANNLAGRALLDSGQPRAAAEALLANYRGNPKGERAPDSLFYLGQSLVALKQSTQACKAYAELEEVYGARIRDDLKRLLPAAKAKAGCK
jgi:TolA-binding protein